MAQPDIVVHVDKLKNIVPPESDSLMKLLKHRKDDCKTRRAAYWKHHSLMRSRHNWISIPLLIVSSATGVVSAIQFNSRGDLPFTVATTVLGVLSAVLSSVQRYCQYSERAENSKLMAKSWSRLQRKIEHTMVYIESNACEINSSVFTKLVEEIQKDIESVAQQAEDLPLALLKERPLEENQNQN
jgi:K+ transporter